MDNESQRLAQQSMAFVLAGGRGSRLLELTDRRAKPAMYFGGKSRIIDFALSNAVNSGIRRMASATCNAAGPSSARNATSRWISCPHRNSWTRKTGTRARQTP
jgi:hypothetical protein